MNSFVDLRNPDIYFDENYGKLYEKIENGKAEIFNFNCEIGEIKNLFIKREIPIYAGDTKYYDVITPYGYGGPIILNCLKDKKEELVQRYLEEFSKYCFENNIVSEFIRFHPLLKNVKDFEKIYDVSCIRKTLGTNLKDFDDPVESEFSKSCRRNIRKALNKGVTFEVIEKPEPDDIGDFKKIYYSTMDRNKAKDYYYFDEDYFEKILTYFKENVITVKAIYENKIIAQGLYFVYGKYIHIHLSGTLSEYLYLSPAYVLRYAVTLWGKENGYEMIHHGGGRTNSVDDGLYKFKKGFGRKSEFDFYIGRKVWNKKVYDELCDIKGIDKNIEFFPAYRCENGE